MQLKVKLGAKQMSGIRLFVRSETGGKNSWQYFVLLCQDQMFQ